jgi:hypothetical protein
MVFTSTTLIDVQGSAMWVGACPQSDASSCRADLLLAPSNGVPETACRLTSEEWSKCPRNVIEELRKSTGVIFLTALQRHKMRTFGRFDNSLYSARVRIFAFWYVRKQCLGCDPGKPRFLDITIDLPIGQPPILSGASWRTYRWDRRARQRRTDAEYRDHDFKPCACA